MKRFAFAVVILSLIHPSIAAPRQRPTASKGPAANPHKLIAVKATGSSRYNDKEILAASGLELGQNTAEADFQEAVQRLGNSGMFSEVLYSFSYSDAGTQVNFQLTDIDKSKLVAAHFENFVWFTESELRASLEQRVPLFQDRLRVTGPMPDLVTQALQALLDERHLPGRVDYLREGKPDGGDLIGIVYRVEEIGIHIHSVDFPGATPEQAIFLTRGARKLMDVEYSRSMLATVAHYDLLPLFLQRGYLKAVFGPAEAHVLTASPTQATNPTSAQSAVSPNLPEETNIQNAVEVNAILPVVPGKQYSVSDVNWKGNSVVTTKEALTYIHLVVGEPADAIRLLSDIDDLKKLYRSRGYMAVQIKPIPKMDDEKSTVAYDINIAEGDLYRMGEIEILGVDTPSRDRLREAWALREGQPYNADYTRKFLDDASRLLPKGLQYSVKVDEELDARDKTVDVTIHFKPR